MVFLKLGNRFVAVPNEKMSSSCVTDAIMATTWIAFHLPLLKSLWKTGSAHSVMVHRLLLLSTLEEPRLL